MKYTSIAAATILALAGTAPVFAGDKSHSSMEGRTGASASSMQQGQYDQQTIRQVQEQLSQKGHDVDVDGQMGPKTQQALKKFQKDEGLQASGRLDQQTLTALGVEQSGSVGGQGGMTGGSGASDASGGDSRAGSSSGLGGSSRGMGGDSGGSSSITGSGSTSR